MPPVAVNPLQARLFGVWTLMSAAVRIYAAYNLHLKPYASPIFSPRRPTLLPLHSQKLTTSTCRMYDLAIVSYILALGHFASEATVYGTAGVQGLAGPLVVACELSVSL